MCIYGEDRLWWVLKGRAGSACCHDREISEKKENRKANAIKGLPSRVTWGKFPLVYFAVIQ